jgi:hypothetical protein
MGLMEEGMGLIDSLFEQFVKIRISDDWDGKEIPKIRKWAS